MMNKLSFELEAARERDELLAEFCLLFGGCDLFREPELFASSEELLIGCYLLDRAERPEDEELFETVADTEKAETPEHLEYSILCTRDELAEKKKRLIAFFKSRGYSVTELDNHLEIYCSFGTLIIYFETGEDEYGNKNERQS